MDQVHVSHIFDASILCAGDIRAVVGETLSRTDAKALGLSVGTLVQREGGRCVVVARDGRLSSPALASALVDGLVASGCTVVNVGLGSTPMLGFAVHHLMADAGVMVTGSHGPAAWNGFRLVRRQRAVQAADILELGAIAAAADWKLGAGVLKAYPVSERYVDRLLYGFRGGHFTVAWDCGNGTAGPIVERLVQRLPGTHHVLNSQVDARFPHHDPDSAVEANLADLKRAVCAHGCDFGVAFDGDADRIGVIDSAGRVVSADELLAILAEPMLRDLPGSIVVTDAKSNQAVFDRVSVLGGTAIMAQTGCGHIMAKMQEVYAPLAGDLSGHFFFGHRWYGLDDAILAALRLIEAVHASGQSLAVLKDALSRPVNTP